MLKEEKRITTKRQLTDFLIVEVRDKGKLSSLKRLFGLSERAVLDKHQILLRKTEYYTNTGKTILGLVYRIRLNRFQNKYSIHVPLNCCGKGLKIMHVGPVLMNGNVTVGENCSFHMNTALVAGGVTDAAPTVGNNVVVGVGAVIVGGVCIADHVAVGANAVVVKDVLEENIAVAGVPAKKVSNNGSKEWNRKS